MPYISKARRLGGSDSDPVRLRRGNTVFYPENTGDLTYALTLLGDQFLRDQDHFKDFDALSKVIAALECTKLEFYRRLTGPYEDQKIRENGDVFSKENL